MAKNKTSIIGFGYVGKAYHKVFPDAVIYDPYYEEEKLMSYSGNEGGVTSETYAVAKPYADNKKEANNSELAVVCVPTDPLPDGSLDTSIVEEVVGWLEADYILIKSALMPGTADRLVKETGKKIAVSVEYVGMGNYYIDSHLYPDPTDPRKHQMIVIGGEQEPRDYCAQRLWQRMSPTTKIVPMSAKEAEITKLVENSYPALKVTFVNSLATVAEKSGVSYINVHQGWTADPRVDGMHLRALTFNRGWTSHCWDKDIPALAKYSRDIGADDMADLLEEAIRINRGHLGDNVKD